MASRSFEMEPIDEIAVGTLGDPGQRQFFLQARGGGQTVTLGCEKFHIQGLVTRIQQLLEAQGLQPGPEPDPVGSVQEPLAPEWTIAELGLGYHESRKLFVIVAREQGEGDDRATARLWASPAQVRAFAKQAAEVLAGGRPTCQYCGLPIDPSGHPCPAQNGSRPIF
jgi:uncharacterized repeat protein (TIGR03847 family)